MTTAERSAPAAASTDSTARARRSNALTLALASLGFVSLGLPEGALGVAWPSIRAAFGLPLDALGLLLGTFATGYFVSSAVSGRVLARLGVGVALAVSCALTGSSLLGYAVAPAWLTMVALGGVLGLGAGTIDAGLNTYAAVQHGARVLNWMHAAFGLGAAVGPLLMTAIIGAGLGWNLGYAVVAALQLALAASYALTRGRFATPTATRAPHAEPMSSFDERDDRAVAVGVAPALWRNPLMWLSAALFFVYVGIEAGAGQWSFSLFTISRQMPAPLAGVLISAYWGALTIGRVLFGVVAPHVSSDRLLRASMVVTAGACALLWLNVPIASGVALVVLGLVLAPVFPVLIAETPARLGLGKTADAVGLQVAAAVLGGASLPALMGVFAARVNLEVIGGCLLAAAVTQLALHEVLIRRASGRPRNARSRSVAAASFPPGA